MAEKSRDLRIAALTRFAIAITLLNVAGHLWLGFEQSLAHPLVGIAAAYSTELLLETIDAWAYRRRARYAGGLRSFILFLLPAHITGLATAMLLYTNARLMPIAFAAVVGISSKYLFRVRIGTQQRHFFNPSNFGITITLLAFPWIGIAMPYMFTESLVSWGNWVLPMVMIAAGTTLNALFTKRVPLIVTWVTAFVLQAYIRSIVAGALFVPALMPMVGVAFILFTFYMVTDPATTPTTVRGQIMFGASVAMVYGLLVTNHVVFGMFFALSLVCLSRGVTVWVLDTIRSRAPAPDAAAVQRIPASQPMDRSVFVEIGQSK